MKKIILLTFSIITLLIPFLSLSSQPVCAAGVGAACCASGYSYKNGSCLSGNFKQVCTVFAATACANPFTWIDTPKCLNVSNEQCLNYLGSSYDPNNICNHINDSWYLLFPSIFNTIARTAFSQVCVPAMTTAISSISKVAQPSQCDANLMCYETTQTCINPADAQFIYQVCSNIPSENQTAINDCTNCLTSDPYTNTGAGIWTAVGCINISPSGFIKNILTLALGLAGGLALLLMIYGAFTISISAGDPKKADEGRQIIGGAIGGLIIIIFSIVILRLIGVDILQIPGF